jgi:release factor glutamine methyltransferase
MVDSASLHPPVPEGDTTSAVVLTLRAAGCVFAEDEARLLVVEATTGRDLQAMVARRVAGEPLEQILGWAEFCGRRYAVEPGVFVPRRRTELLVAEAVSLATPGAIVIDLCCGSGAVGLAIATEIGTDRLFLTDLDPAAVRCARRNASGTTAGVYLGDLDEALPRSLRGRVDILAANAPYVPSQEIRTMPPEARIHEHRIALDGGVDGLAIQRRVAAIAPDWLRPGGHVLIETSEAQADRTVAALTQHGLMARLVRSDDLDATVAIGTVYGG